MQDRETEHSGLLEVRYDHLHFWVGNARRAAELFCLRYGMGLWGGKFSRVRRSNRSDWIRTLVVRGGGITLLFSSRVASPATTTGDWRDEATMTPFPDDGRLMQCGDAVFNVALCCRDVLGMCARLNEKHILRGPQLFPPGSEDGRDAVITCVLRGCDQSCLSHTLVQRSVTREDIARMRDAGFSQNTRSKDQVWMPKSGTKEWFSPIHPPIGQPLCAFGQLLALRPATSVWPRKSSAPWSALSRSTATGLLRVDHVAMNQPSTTLSVSAEYYAKVFQFKRFWAYDNEDEKSVDSVTPKDDASDPLNVYITTGTTSLRTTVLHLPTHDHGQPQSLVMSVPGDERKHAKEGVKSSQISEYLHYMGDTGGVQHIAFVTNDICATVSALKNRGVQFIDVPARYFEELAERLESDQDPHKHLQNLKKYQHLSVLLDYDHKGYLLQTFTKPLTDRPTVFFEIIERSNHRGFGAGNIKALFRAVEGDQRRRGNL